MNIFINLPFEFLRKIVLFSFWFDKFKFIFIIYDCSYITFVRTRFVSNRNCVGFARKKAQTISFVERRFERLGLGHRTVVRVGSGQ